MFPFVSICRLGRIGRSFLERYFFAKLEIMSALKCIVFIFVSTMAMAGNRLNTQGTGQCILTGRPISYQLKLAIELGADAKPAKAWLEGFESPGTSIRLASPQELKLKPMGGFEKVSLTFQVSPGAEFTHADLEGVSLGPVSSGRVDLMNRIPGKPETKCRSTWIAR